jgi:hypothetical protein
VKSPPVSVVPLFTSLGCVVSAVVKRETGSAFDATSYKGVEAPGAHPPPSSSEPDAAAFSYHRSTEKPTPTSALCVRAPPSFQSRVEVASSWFCVNVPPTEWLKKGTGLGGTRDIAVVEEAVKVRTELAGGTKSSPGPAAAYKKRPNPPNSELRRFYERGDLPVVIDQKYDLTRLLPLSLVLPPLNRIDSMIAGV